jgi:hypothetical protein
MRQCPNCLKLDIGPKPESEFNKSKKAHDGLQSWCRNCQKARHHANGDDCRARSKAWHHAHAEYAAERNRQWRERNPRASAASGRAWAERNPVLADIGLAARVRKHQAKKLHRVPAWADHEKIKDMYAQARAAREFFPEVEWHVDHIFPLRGKKVSGLHVHTNLQVVPGVANRRKAARVQVEFGKDMRDLVRAA